MTTKQQQKEFLKAIKKTFSEDAPSKPKETLKQHPTIIVGGDP